ncbi:MAG: DUF1349 domain-containing protein [Chloroflexi bacterium]|nr:DUF1349 domain-containing protein [Chloroflexota bacterium]
MTTTLNACDSAGSTNCIGAQRSSLAAQASPVIDIWYGSNQVFGAIGVPQQWVNILGNVADSDGIKSLVYSLNGGPASTLSVGPDTRRLAAAVDFNVELDYTDLISGLNQVVITATDQLNIQTVQPVTVEYQGSHIWPKTYSVDWSSVAAIANAAQIVDGLWALEADSIHPLQLGYDRLVAIGDLSWDDYEVTVPITVHSIDPAGYNPPSNGPAVGLVMRWDGHDDWGGGWQPRIGWYPMGAFGAYSWQNNRLKMLGGTNGAVIATETSTRTFGLNITYNFKMRVETVPGQGGLYSLKVWQNGLPEPATWDLTAQEQLADPQNGSLLLLAHHVDASFGDVTITPGPFISNIQVTPSETSATIKWNTNEPATSKVAYGLSPAHELGNVSNNALVTQHTMTLTNLISGTLYHYQLTSIDGSNNTASSTDLTFRTLGVTSGIVSDDFNKPSLDTSLWTFINPLGDAALTVTGINTPNAWVSMSVPAAVSHDVWTSGINAPRIMQPVINNTDFEIEAKFETGLVATYQMHGVLVQQDSNNFIRFNFHSKDSKTYLFAASFTNGAPSTKINQGIINTNVAPLYMRVNRTGNQWILSYSYNGQSWNTGGSFTHTLTVTSVGAFVGNVNNGANPAPAYTGSIDYFFNTVSPIVPEDGLPSGPGDNKVFLPLILR